MPTLTTLLRILFVWALIAVAETAMGAVRHMLVSPQAEFAVRQAAVFVSLGVTFAITWLALPWMRLKTQAGALAVGAVWAAFTVAFDLILGQALGFGWDRLLEDYDLAHGGMMPVGLLLMVLTPWAALRLRGRGSPAA